jgi:hypothetical protein
MSEQIKIKIETPELRGHLYSILIEVMDKIRSVLSERQKE